MRKTDSLSSRNYIAGSSWIISYNKGDFMLRKNWLSILGLLLFVMVIASGCGSINKDINELKSDTTTPLAPTGVTATPGNGDVTIAWTAVSGAISYNIYWSNTSGVNLSNGNMIPLVTSPYIQTGLTNSTPYYYVVTAVNGFGESNPSTQVMATPSASVAPFINATVLSVTGGTNPLSQLQQVWVYTDISQSTPVENATVTVNGTTLTYNTANSSYQGTAAIATGATVSLSVAIPGGSTYTATGTQYTTFPDVTAPTSDATWQPGNANTITWSAGAPTAGATYFVGVTDINGNLVYPAGNNGSSNVSTSSTSYPIPANSLTAGSYFVYVGIGTTGIADEISGGIPIANAATGSDLWIGGIASFVPITVQ